LSFYKIVLLRSSSFYG